MKTKLYEWEGNELREHHKTRKVNLTHPQLVLAFGDKEKIKNPEFYNKLCEQFKGAEIAICSTAGEIADVEVKDEGIIITALEFEKTKLAAVSVNINEFTNSREAGAALAKKLEHENLSYVLVLSDGALVNGSELIIGIETIYQNKLPITGGLAADGIKFQSTGVGLNQVPQHGVIVAIGFYGKNLKIGHGTSGGWTVFGVEKTITKSSGNVLYEIENKNALTFYKEYLGKYAEDLPFSALHFPLAIQQENSDKMLVRTILSIDEEKQSLTFAGDIPCGSKIRLMRANFEALIEAASDAASFSGREVIGNNPDYVLLISCVGRKLILKNRIDEEVEVVANNFDSDTVISGFYSNGELAPFNGDEHCQLHNQTMTITTFKEIDGYEKA